ncbi:MAG TPA: phosphotransferase, partial [Clostridia bacterium]
MKKYLIDFDTGVLPEGVKDIIHSAAFYDSSCSNTARTIYIEGAERMYLKIAASGSLEREFNMCSFLSSKSLAPEVIKYEKDDSGDYLLTLCVQGEDGTSEMYLERPFELAQVFGESLRVLHSIPHENCPYTERNEEIIKEALENASNGGVDRDFLQQELGVSVDKALTDVLLMKDIAIKDVVIHGDYCLPNIILKDFIFSSFIDAGYGGLG